MKMNRVLVLSCMLAAVSLFGLIGCGGTQSNSDSQTNKPATNESSTAAETPETQSASVADYVTVTGAYWRNAFENGDYSDFADDEERELFVFMKVKPAEDKEIQIGGAGSGSANHFVSLTAGTKDCIDSLVYNFNHSYYEPLEEAGYISPHSTMLKPYEKPAKCVAKFYVEGWMVKKAKSVTLNVNSLYVGGESVEGTIDIPQDSIEPVSVKSDGQPGHTAMIKKMVKMAEK